MDNFHLTKSELEIMQYIWSVDREITARDIREHFVHKNWSKQTITKFLKNLVDINFLKVRKESLIKYYYSATLSEYEYSILPAQAVFKNVFSGSYSSFCCALLPKGASKEDINKLKAILDAFEKEIGCQQE